MVLATFLGLSLYRAVLVSDSNIDQMVHGPNPNRVVKVLAQSEQFMVLATSKVVSDIDSIQAIMGFGLDKVISIPSWPD